MKINFYTILFENLLFKKIAYLLFFFLFSSAYTTKAVADKENYVAEMNQLFSGDGVLLKLKIEVPESSAASLRKDPRKYAPCVVTEGDRVYTNVAIHLKGSAGSFRGFDDPKPGFTLNFSYFRPGQRFHGVRKIHLNNSAQDPTFLSEYICGHLFRSAGVPATRVAHAFVQVNNRPTQFYVLKESFEKEFFSQFFGSPEGNAYGESGGIDVDSPMHRMEGEGVNDKSDLKQLASAIQEKDTNKCYTMLNSILDVERFISFMAIEVMLCHWDGYTFARHNYRLYHDPSNGKFTFIPHDLDQMMNDSNVPIVPGVNGLVAQTIYRIPETKKRYIERFEEIFLNNFRPDDLTNRIDTIVGKLKPKIAEVDKNFAQEFENRSHNLKQRIINRAQSIDRQFASMKLKTAENIIIKPENWKKAGGESGAQFDIVKDKDGRTALYIKANSSTTAMWKTTVNLWKGNYVFEALARCENVKPISDEQGEGAGLRTSVNQLKRENKLINNSPWQKLEYKFSIDSPQDVELICELRAQTGEVWFDVASMKVYKK